MPDPEEADDLNPPTSSIAGDDSSASGPLAAASHQRPPRSSTAFLSGDLIGARYRIVRFIAAGGMGEVYEAEDLVLKRRLALKTIRGDGGEDPRAVERFKREIQIALTITHPGICRIYDIGFHRTGGESGAASSELLFLTMELLDGETLSRRISRRKRLGLAEALGIVEQLAAGLDAAHSLGVIHRDFKSGNVILVPSADPRKTERAVITDFGLARPVSSRDSVASISDTGAVVGTPAYMAPEQVEGRPLTTAADTYALGIVVYEMVTGVRPFDGGSPITVAVKRLNEAPLPPERHVTELPPEWSAAILRCLERNPAARFGSALDFVRSLRGERVSEPAPPSPSATSSLVIPSASTLTRPRPAQRRTAAAVLALALVAGVLGFYRNWHRERPDQTPSATAVAPRRAIAVLGLENLSGDPSAAWLSIAISEMLTTDLGAGGKLRAISGGDVADAKRDAGLGADQSPSRSQLARIRADLGADLVVAGSFSTVGSGPTRLVRIDLRLSDTRSGDTVASGSASGTETQLFDLVSRAGEPLRTKLALGPASAADSLAVKATLPRDPEAAKAYAVGLDRLRAFDGAGAREALEKAVAADPRHPLPHSALAAAWALLGHDVKARESAERAVALGESLPAEQRQLLQARLRELTRDWDAAIADYRTLFRASPDNLEYGLLLAEAQTSGGQQREALATADTLKALPDPIAADPRIDLAAARAHGELGDFRRELESAREAVRKGADHQLVLARGRLLEGIALAFLGEKAQATEAFERAKRHYESASDRQGAATALAQMALTLDDGGDQDGARRLYEKALAVFRETGNQRETAKVLFNIGTVLYEQGKLAEAQPLFADSLRTFREAGMKYEAAVAQNDAGALLQNGGNLAAAEKMYHDALAAFGEIGDKRGTAMALTNLGELQHARGALSIAQEMHEESLAINREISEKSGIAHDLYRLGELFSDKGDLLVARGKYEEALAIQEQLKDAVAAAQTRVGLALLQVRQGQAPQAEQTARAAEEVARAEGASDVQLLAHTAIAEALLSQGKLDPAREVCTEARRLAGSSQDRRARLAVTLIAARVEAASSQAAERAAARRALNAVIVDASRLGFLGYEYQARLALGRLDLAGGGGNDARSRLAALSREARAKGFALVAREAEAARPPT